MKVAFFHCIKLVYILNKDKNYSINLLNLTYNSFYTEESFDNLQIFENSVRRAPIPE